MKKRLCAILVTLVLILSTPAVVFAGPIHWPILPPPPAPSSACIACCTDLGDNFEGARGPDCPVFPASPSN